MAAAMDDESLAEFLETVEVGDIVAGVVTEVTRSAAVVLLDGFSSHPIGFIGALDLSWRSFRRSPTAALEVGARVRAEVLAVDLPGQRVQLSLSATENPRLWEFLKALRPGQRLSGTVAAVKQFGVFVDLDDGPDHPVFPGVGFITIPELSWLRIEDPHDVVSVGQHITCEFMGFDIPNGEARLSLCAIQPDPFQQFISRVDVGQVLHGLVTKLVPFGAFVRVEDGIEGLVHLSELADSPVDRPEQAVDVGDSVVVVITEIDPQRRRLALSQRAVRQ
ncbi:S1 RNA-binding domain-containing protein [Actinomadura sp. NPDC023710]|uniref:S1 RNA-binding domain-containing protein n=1 Tax=Actinomadura sp. NPDC023710 TaxID=3158219 RepID=UPI0033F50FA3